MSNQHIILICGKKGAGKDTLAEFFRPAYLRTAFADAIYVQTSKSFDVPIRELRHRAIKEIPVTTLAIKRCSDKDFVARCEELGLDLECPRSPREVVQLRGTEYAQHRFGKYHWADQVVEEFRENPTTDFVVPDLRFPHEAERVNEYAESVGATVTVFRVLRPDLVPTKESAHVSEQSMDDYSLIDLVIHNEPGNPDSMRSQIASWLDR